MMSIEFSDHQPRDYMQQSGSKCSIRKTKTHSINIPSMSLQSIRKDTHEHIYTTQSDDCYEMLWNRKAKVTESCKRFHICLYLHNQHPQFYIQARSYDIGYSDIPLYANYSIVMSYQSLAHFILLSTKCAMNIIKLFRYILQMLVLSWNSPKFWS